MPPFGGHGGGHRRKLLKIGANFIYRKVRKIPSFVVKLGIFWWR